MSVEGVFIAGTAAARFLAIQIVGCQDCLGERGSSESRLPWQECTLP